MGIIRAGVIGAGFIGPVHIEALQRLGIPVAALCDFDASKAAAAARKWNIPQVVTGGEYRRLVESPDVDVVHIASPNRYHLEMALAAIRAGKHCICEKPLAMNSREAARIAAAARGAGTVFAVNYNLRFYPAVLQLRALVQRGDLGEIIHVNGSYFQDWLLWPTDYNWRLLPEEGGALRAVADIGTHWLDTAAFVLGTRIESVLAHLATFHQTRLRPVGEVTTFSRAAARQKYQRYAVKTEDYASVLLRFASGAHGNLGVSQVAAGRKNCIRLEVYGSRQSAWWCSEEPDYLHLGRRDGGNETRFRATPGFAEDIAGFTDYPAGHAEGFPDTFKMLARAVYAEIAARKSGGAVPGARARRDRPARARPLFATAEDGHAEVRVCEAILRSHRSRRWVDV